MNTKIRTRIPGVEFVESGHPVAYVANYLESRGLTDIPETIIHESVVYQYMGMVFGRARFERVE